MRKAMINEFYFPFKIFAVCRVHTYVVWVYKVYTHGYIRNGQIKRFGSRLFDLRVPASSHLCSSAARFH